MSHGQGSVEPSRSLRLRCCSGSRDMHSIAKCRLGGQTPPTNLLFALGRPVAGRLETGLADLVADGEQLGDLGAGLLQREWE